MEEHNEGEKEVQRKRGREKKGANGSENKIRVRA